MEFFLWIKSCFDNGELVFYLIPFFLFVMLLTVVFIPDSKKKKEKNEEKDKIKQPERKRSGFTTKEMYPEKDSNREYQQTLDLTGGEPPAELKSGEKSVDPKTLEEGLAKTKSGFISRLRNIFSATKVTPELIEEMEEILYTADMGINTVGWLLDEVNREKNSFQSGEDVKLFLCLLYTSPSPRDRTRSRMPSSA